MDKIKRVVNAVLPVSVCNLRCHYCFLGREDRLEHSPIDPLKYSNEYIAKALRKERMGGNCLIVLCAVGETLLAPDLLDLSTRLIAEGHYIQIVTNGILTGELQKYASLSQETKNHLFFKFSFHYLEFTKRQLLNRFFNNVRLVRDAGISFTVELTANDEAIPEIPQIQEECQRELGALCHINESRDTLRDDYGRLTKMSCEKHLTAWDIFQSDMFAFQTQQWGKKQKNFCYAGDWLINLYLDTGNITPCLGGGSVIQNIFEDLDEPIHFAAVGQSCPWPHCFCMHATQTFGLVPNKSAPTYGQIRNRLCNDGTEWLQPEMCAFFQTTALQSNKQYSKEKQTYISALMGFEYKQEKSISDEEVAGAIAEGLRKKNVNSLAIYGTGTYAVWLLPLLGKSRVSLAFQVDEKYGCEDKASLMTKLKRRVKYRIKRTLNGNGQPVLLNRYDHWPKVDMVVVSDYKEITKHKAEILAAHPQVHIVPITELID